MPLKIAPVKTYITGIKMSPLKLETDKAPIAKERDVTI